MPAAGLQSVYASGECEIDLARRELRLAGTPVPIGGRAFAVLEVLARSSGQLVTKNELLNRIWPGQTVNDNTLQAHIAALRKALGSRRTMLKTESGHGYRLLGDWAVRHAPAPLSVVVPFKPPRRAESPPATNLPIVATPPIGRSAAAEQLRDLVSAYRVVTLMGPGGIGKTTLALELGRNLLRDFADGCWLVELAALSDPVLVPSAVASVLGPTLVGGTLSSATVAGAIGRQHLLLILDNCEHVIDAVAEFIETVVRQCPNTTLLTTSREIIRIDGEHVYRVPPLDVPARGAVQNILDHSAVELFIARAKALGYSPNAEALPLIADICRRLDGIPLAIEFAAARTAALGIEHVATGLSDRFALLTSGRRTALARHRTLRAALDWSYQLLSAAEQDLLDRLAMFAGPFSIGAAAALAADGMQASEVAGIMGDLVGKSLVSTVASPATSEFRLLETMRAYASDRLRESGAWNAVARRHAAYFRDLFEQAEADSETGSAGPWPEGYDPHIDNLRSALDWCFSADGDAEIGTTLTCAAIPLWLRSSLLSECRTRVAQALAVSCSAGRDPRREMKMLAALAATSLYTQGPTDAVEEYSARALAIARALNDPESQSRALWCLCTFHLAKGEFRLALDVARRVSALAAMQPDRGYGLLGERMIGISEHFLGEQPQAREHLEHVLANFRAPAGEISIGFDQRVSAHTILARVLWLMGFPDQATATADAAVERAREANHAASLCYALADAACLIALWRGDLAAAGRHVEALVDLSTRLALPAWRPVGRMFQAVLMVRRGDSADGLPRLRAGILDQDEPLYAWTRGMFLRELAEGLAHAGQVDDALAVVRQGIDRREHTEENWLMAEFLRLNGELLAQSAAPDAVPAAEAHFRQAIDWSRRQGALSWELRACASLARLLRDQGRAAEAKALLQPLYDRFTEGFDTADLKDAKLFLDAL